MQNDDPNGYGTEGANQMSTTLIHSSPQPTTPGWTPDIPPLAPPGTPLPAAPQVAAPLIYVQKSTQWEYQQLVRNLSKEAAPTAAELNTLGKEGWELAGVTTDAPFVYFYFKRVKA